MNKMVQFVILIRMRTLSSQFRLVEFRKRRWVSSIRNTEEIFHSIITTPIFHHNLTIRCKIHHLQTFTLLIVGIGSLRAVTEFRIDLYRNLSGSILMIVHHFTIRISHCLHTVPAIIRSTIDISPYICHTRHDCTDGLCHLPLSTVVVGFTARSILNEGKTTGTVILIASLTIGISNTIKEVFWIKHLMESFKVVGVRNVTLVRYRLPKLCRELRQEVACRIIGHIRFTRIRMIHHQFATKQVISILRLPAVRMLNRHHLSDRVIAVLSHILLTRRKFKIFGTFYYFWGSLRFENH